MFQKFYVNTIQSNFIKYLLQNTNIPIIPFIKNINHMTKNQLYIHDGYIVRAKISDNVNEVLKKIRDNPETYVRYFQKYQPYIFGREYKGLTTKYVSNTGMYDPETHYYLGQYLRAYKAYYNIDLMPFYNCFSDEYISNIKLTKTEVEFGAPFVNYTNESNTKYKILSVPISFCKEYTIAMDCDTEVLCVPVLLGNKGILTDLTNKMWSTLNVATHPELHLQSNYIFNTLSFNKPKYYHSPCIPGVEDLDQLSLPTYEKYLRLLIRIPEGNNSSIVILEGHYENVRSYTEKVINLHKDTVTQLINKIELDERIQYQSLYNTESETWGPITQSFDAINNIICTNIKESFISCIASKDSAQGLNPLEGEATSSFNITPLKFSINNSDYYIKVNVSTSVNPNWVTALDLLDSTRSKKLLLNEFYKLNEPVIIVNQSNDDITNDFLQSVKLDGKPLNEYTPYESILITENTIISFDDSNDLNYLTSPDSKLYIPILSGEHNNCLSLYLERKTVKNESGEIVVDEEGNATEDVYKQLIIHQDDITVNAVNVSDINLSIISNSDLKNLGISLDYIGETKQYLVLTVPNTAINITALQPISHWTVKMWTETSDVFTKYLNDNLITNLSLLRLNDHNSYAFCSRLYEYLVNQVITSIDNFEQNIKTIQKKLHDPETGIWTEEFRLKIFNKTKDYIEKYNLFKIDDMNGFVDKDTENIILSLP